MTMQYVRHLTHDLPANCVCW